MLACQDEETGGFADRPGDMVSCCLIPCLCLWQVFWPDILKAHRHTRTFYIYIYAECVTVQLKLF